MAIFVALSYASGLRPAHAAKFDKSVGAGATYFSGKESNNLLPGLSPFATFAANFLFSRRVNLVNRFEFGLLLSGKNFGGSLGTYSGYHGGYEMGFRFNVGKETVFPYIELGGLLGMWIVQLSSAPSSKESENQTALKFGYVIGTGFDFVKAGKRGDGNGFGLGFFYFGYMKSPSMFEFPSAKLAAGGIKLEARFLIKNQ